MGVRFPFVLSNVIVNTNVVTTAETVVAILPTFSPSMDSGIIAIFGYVSIVAGTGTTQIGPHLRRGTTVAGAQLQVTAPGIDCVAGHFIGAHCFYFDVFPGLAGGQYCLTVAQSNASSNGTVNDALIFAFAL